MTNGFNLHLPSKASDARRIAHRKLAEAAEALSKATDGVSWQAATAMQDRAQRNCGAILLREDKQRRPHIYSK